MKAPYSEEIYSKLTQCWKVHSVTVAITKKKEYKGKDLDLGNVKPISFTSGVKGQGSDRWWERRCMQDEVDKEESEQNEQLDGMKKGTSRDINIINRQMSVN